MSKEFVFLFPITPYLKIETKQVVHIPDFKQKYQEIFNECIDVRYRQKRFNINFVLNKGQSVSTMIVNRPNDKTIVMYPKNNWASAITGFDKNTVLRIAGFHLFDCVDKLAETAYKSGIKNTKVDEDLTEFFAHRVIEPDFDVSKTPNIDRSLFTSEFFQMYKIARQNKPWLNQK